MSEIRDKVQEMVDRIRDHDRSKLYETQESLESVHCVAQVLVRLSYHTSARKTRVETKAVPS